MLSAKQKKLRELSKTAEGENTAAKVVVPAKKEPKKVKVLKSNGTQVQETNYEFDSDRIAELWANLAMVKQMHGDDKWIIESQKSGLEWAEYIAQFIKQDEIKVINFDTGEKIFGFALLRLNKNKANEKAADAFVEEMYLEPNNTDETNDELAVKLQLCFESMSLNNVEYTMKKLFS